MSKLRQLTCVVLTCCDRLQLSRTANTNASITTCVCVAPRSRVPSYLAVCRNLFTGDLPSWTTALTALARYNVCQCCCCPGGPTLSDSSLAVVTADSQPTADTVSVRDRNRYLCRRLLLPDILLVDQCEPVPGRYRSPCVVCRSHGIVTAALCIFPLTRPMVQGNSATLQA